MWHIFIGGDVRCELGGGFHSVSNGYVMEGSKRPKLKVIKMKKFIFKSQGVIRKDQTTGTTLVFDPKKRQSNLAVFFWAFVGIDHSFMIGGRNYCTHYEKGTPTSKRWPKAYSRYAH